MAFVRVICIQRPIIPPDGEWLIYDEAREHVESRYPSQFLRDLMGSRMRAFFKATWSVENGWVITRRIRKEQHWS
jgi:hypothetical protein